MVPRFSVRCCVARLHTYSECGRGSPRAHAAPRDPCTARACAGFACGSSPGLLRDSCARSIPEGPASPSNPHRSGPCKHPLVCSGPRGCATACRCKDPQLFRFQDRSGGERSPFSTRICPPPLPATLPLGFPPRKQPLALWDPRGERAQCCSLSHLMLPSALPLSFPRFLL